MMKGTIGALISPGKVTTCVSEALPLLLLLWLPFLFIIEMSVGRQTERKEEIKAERESESKRCRVRELKEFV